MKGEIETCSHFSMVRQCQAIKRHLQKAPHNSNISKRWKWDEKKIFFPLWNIFRRAWKLESSLHCVHYFGITILSAASLLWLLINSLSFSHFKLLLFYPFFSVSKIERDKKKSTVTPFNVCIIVFIQNSFKGDTTMATVENSINYEMTSDG